MTRRPPDFGALKKGPSLAAGMRAAIEEKESAIEELKSANEELAKAIADLTRANDDSANFIASTQIPCVMLSADLNIRRFTPAAARLFNLIAGDIGRPITRLRPALRGVELRGLAVETLNGARLPCREVRDRRGRWHSLVVRPCSTGKGKLDGVVIALLDIDELKRGVQQVERSREALRVSESRLRLVTDNIPGLISYVDRSLRLAYVNKRSREYHNAPSDEVIGRPLRSVIGAAAFKGALPYIRKALAGQTVTYENIIPRRGGGRTVTVTLLPDFAGRKRPRGYFAMVLDTTGRREDERLRLIVESAPTGILLADAAGRIVMANARLNEIFGYKPRELIGKPVGRLVPLPFRSGHSAAHRAYASAPEPRMMHGREFVGLRKDGTDFPVEVSLCPIRSVGQTLFMATVVDLTDRLKAREDERQRDVERSQAGLLADLSHELKTPIATIRAAAETLLAPGVGASASAPRFLKAIGSQTERLSKLVDNLVRLAARGAGARPPKAARFSLSSLARACVEEYSFPAGERSISLRGRIEPGVILRADRDGVRQTLENLIDNAIQYNRAGGKVEVGVRRAGSEALVTVSDDGVGIAKEDLPTIFQRFRRTGRARRLKPSGTGLGLALVKRVVDAHKGRVWVASRPGRGTAFHLAFPSA